MHAINAISNFRIQRIPLTAGDEKTAALNMTNLPTYYYRNENSSIPERGGSLLMQTN
jgi:hypothetical protein